MQDLRRAGTATLEKLPELLSILRSMPPLVEKRPGVFYLGRKELLHFHETADGIVADIFLPGERLRLPVTTRSEQMEALDRIAPAVDSCAPALDRGAR